MMLLIGLLILIIIISIVLSSIKLNKENLYDDNSDCAKTYAQCGGKNWSGQTNCCPGNICKPQNDYYSQCLPGSGPTPGPSPPSPPPPHPSPPPPHPSPPPPHPSPPPPHPSPPPPHPSPPPPGPSPNCSPAYGQCGGVNWSGPTCCVSGNTCIKQSQYYSQCKPSSGPSPGPGPSPPSPPAPIPGPHPKHVDGVGFKISDFTPEKWGNKPGIKASTTNFNFGAQSSCGCNGQALTPLLADIGYVGVATPNWLQSTYNTTVQADATGGSTPSYLMNTKYTSNCSSGPGGCNKCFELTVTDGKPGDVPGQQSPVKLLNGNKTETVKVVTIDTCEDRNAYGNNYQWCNSAVNIKPTNTENYTGHDPPPPWGNKLRYGKFEKDDNDITTWIPPPECIDTEGDWVCTNVAGSPLHFDFAIVDLLKSDPNKLLNKINPNIDWSTWDNPIVTVKPIACDSRVEKILQSKCGANSADPPNVETCITYCDPFNQKPDTKNGIASWWGGCDNDWDCAPIDTQCGGLIDNKPYPGPDCCQWGQKCSKSSKYYSGCCDPKTNLKCK